MANRINLGKKIYNIPFDPIKILDIRQNPGKVQFYQMILRTILTYLLMIAKFEKSHLPNLLKFRVKNPEKIYLSQPRPKFAFIYFGLLEHSREGEAISKTNEKFEIASSAAPQPLSQIMLTKYSGTLSITASS